MEEGGGGACTRRWRRRAFPILNPWTITIYTVCVPLSAQCVYAAIATDLSCLVLLWGDKINKTSVLCSVHGMALL